MGVLHAVYGILELFRSLILSLMAPGAGALVAPLVSTQFARSDRWSFHFLCSLGVAFLNTVSLIAVFQFKRQEGSYSNSLNMYVYSYIPSVCLSQIGQRPEEHASNQSGNQFKQILGLKVVHLMALFILMYVGVEVRKLKSKYWRADWSCWRVGDNRRLDCYLCNRRASRRTFSWLHFFGFFRWYISIHLFSQNYKGFLLNYFQV